MTPRELSRNYLRYWTHPQAPYLPGNAPAGLRELHKAVSEYGLPQLHDVLQGLGTGSIPSVPTTLQLLGWAATPGAEAKVDAVLRGHQPPKTMVTLLRAAYLSEMQAMKSKVLNILNAQLEQDVREGSEHV